MSEETKYLLIDLQEYSNEPNNQDINGEYDPPRELETSEAKLLLDLITNLQNQLQQKENIINEVREYANNIKFETKREEKIQDDILEILDKGE